MDIGKTVKSLKERFETPLANEMKKTSATQITKILVVLFASLLFLGIVKTILEHREFDPIFEQILFFIVSCLAIGVWAIGLWIPGKAFKDLRVPFDKALHISAISLTFLISGFAVIFGLMMVTGQVPFIDLILLFLLIPIGPLSSVITIIGAKQVLGTYGQAVKLWVLGQMASIGVAFVLFLAFVMLFIPLYGAVRIGVNSYYTADTVQNAQGTLLTLNETQEGKYTQYCTVQLGKEWTMLEPDPVRDNFYVNEKYNIYNNITRRFVNSYGDELSFISITHVGGDYKQCGKDSGLMLKKDSAICYFTRYENNLPYTKGVYTNSKNIQAVFEYRSSTNNTRFLPVLNTTVCTSKSLSNNPIDNIFFR